MLNSNTARVNLIRSLSTTKVLKLYLLRQIKKKTEQFALQLRLVSDEIIHSDPISKRFEV